MTIRDLVIFLLVAITTSACAQYQPQETQIGVAMLDLSDVQIDPSQATSTVSSTAIPPPTDTASPTSTATNPAPMTTDSQPSLAPSDSPTSSCTNHATVAKHLNVSDNTAFKPGTNFAKVWLVENSGSCTWTTGYKLVFYDGNLISETSEIFLTKGVRPGENIELRINFMAPIDPALYMSDWYLQDLNGILFGVGASGNEPLHIQIEVRRYGTPIVI